MNKIKFNELYKPEYGRREALNSLRTNLQFSGVNLKTFLITSCGPDEGKSTVSFDIARSMAETGKRVILVDADIRKSVMISRHKIERLTRRIGGLSQYLTGIAEAEDIICETNIENFYTIMSGPVAPNPTEILNGDRFEDLMEKLRDEFDVVIIDSPPLGSVIDAAIMAPKCDGAIIVMASGEVSKRVALDVKKQLEVSGCRILGVVLNKVKMEKGQYSKYYGEYK